MGAQRWIKLGFDTVNLLSTVSKFLDQQKAQKKPFRRADAQDVKAPRNLHEIGLDDVEFAVNIDLSQNRTNFKVWCPFDEDFNADLKKEIPKGERRWDAADRCWRVSLRHIGTLHDLLQHHYVGIPLSFTERAASIINDLIHETDAANARTAASAGQDFHLTDEDSDIDPYAILGVTEEAPSEVIKAAHKAQARMSHPDRGGSEIKMQEINRAFEIIKKQRGW